MRLIYFSPVPWDSYEQRPHYFAQHFLASGGEVLWVNPYAARLPNLGDAARFAGRSAPLTLPRPDGLTVLDVNGLPIDPLPGGAWLNERLFWRSTLGRLADFARGGNTILGVGRPTELALTAIDAIPVRSSFYDAMDDFPEFYRGRSRRATRLVEQAIAARVSRLFVSSSHLATKFAGSRERMTFVPNAFDMALLPPVSSSLPITPHIGFIGCVGGWFDWPVVERLARHVHPIPVTVIGPAATRTPPGLPGNVDRRPQCGQIEGVRWLQRFTAGLIPFQRTTLTASVDPIKFYQYRGAGLPVLSTRFGEMAARDAADGTFFLDDGGLEAAVTAALSYRPGAGEVQQFRDANTWAKRLDDLRLLDL